MEAAVKKALLCLHHRDCRMQKPQMGLDSESEMSLCFLKQTGDIKVIQTQQ